MSARVVLHSTPGCHLCDEVRDALVAWGIAFDEVDASEDSGRFLRTPVVDVDGREVAEAPVDLAALEPLVRGTSEGGPKAALKRLFRR